MTDSTRCEICGVIEEAVELIEAELVGAERMICQECHTELQQPF